MWNKLESLKLKVVMNMVLHIYHLVFLMFFRGFYNCASLTAVSFPANYYNKMAYYSTTLGGI